MKPKTFDSNTWQSYYPNPLYVTHPVTSKKKWKKLDDDELAYAAFIRMIWFIELIASCKSGYRSQDAADIAFQELTNLKDEWIRRRHKEHLANGEASRNDMPRPYPNQGLYGHIPMKYLQPPQLAHTGPAPSSSRKPKPRE